MRVWTLMSVDSRVPSAVFLVVGLSALAGARLLLERERLAGRRGRGPVVVLSVASAASLLLSLSLILL